MSENASFFDAAGYDMIQLLGKGSVAKVWLVRDRQFGYVRALKVLDNAVGEDQASSDSFFKECALLLRIGNSGHPNIVWIGRPRVVMDRAMVEMQYVPGRTLTAYIHTDTPFVPYEEILRFIGDIGSALALLHTECYKSMMMPGDDRKMSQEELIARYGISHNDLHTSNIMRRSADGAYILLDFGLAIQDGVAVRSSLRNEGHPEYRAPEKFEAKNGGRQGDIRVDVYSFGVLLFEMLTGNPPFHCEPGDLETGKIYRLHKEAPVPDIEPLRRAAFLRGKPGTDYVRDYPDWLENMVRKCLAKNPDERYANMKEFMDSFHKNIVIEKKLAARREERLWKEKGELIRENEALRTALDEWERKFNSLQASAIAASKVSGKAPEAAPAPTQGGRGTPAWLGVLLGFAPAAVAGNLGAGNLHLSRGTSDETGLDNSEQESVPDEVEVYLDTASQGPLPMASAVSGSFNEAFSAARHEVGPGGVFTWQGHLYSTYTGDEWGRLSPAQQAEFSARVQELESAEEDVELVDAETATDGDLSDTDDVVILNETDFTGDGPSFMGGAPEDVPVE